MQLIPKGNPDEPQPAAPPLETEPEEGMDFETWARAKYREISTRINPCDDRGKLDPLRLNEVLTHFAQDFAWSITMQEVETNKLNRLNHEHDQWYKARYNDTFRTIREETGGAGRAPGQITVEARIIDLFGEEVAVRQAAIDLQKSRVELLKGFVRVLDRQASILQTISSNMRSELFFAAGVPLGGVTSEVDRNKQAKAVLNNAMKGQQTDGS